MFHSEETKGIIVFTHKEIGLIMRNYPEVFDKYNVLVHYGFNVATNADSKISLNMMPNSRCKTTKDIDFTSRNFLDESFSKYDSTIEQINELYSSYGLEYHIEQKYDFLYVGRCAELKKTKEILVYFNKISREKPELTFCLLILKQQIESRYYQEFIQLAEGVNNPKIHIIDTHLISSNNDIFFGFTPPEMALFYNSAKIYIHGCENEGESRSIHEALICGCLCLVKENMKGGGLDFMTEDNSVLYNGTNYLAKMKEALVKQENYEYNDQYLHLFNEQYTKITFAEELHRRLDYASGFELFQSNLHLDNLAMSLPAHNRTVPWYISGKLTADILTQEQLDILKRSIE